MKQTDLITWFYDEIATVLTDTSLVALGDVSQHVGLARERETPQYPFVGIDHDGGDPRSAGIGGDTTFVDHLTFNDNDILQSITYRRDTDLTVELQVLTDGDKALRSDLAQEIRGHFAILSRQRSYATDIQTLRIQETRQAGRPDEFVYGDGTTLPVTYSTFITDPDPDVAKTVNLAVEAAEDSDGTNGSQTDYTISA
jgi:hypothetical protein